MNRLAGETSPYLLQHAENPVDWYPWGEEAFARARADEKPVLLSVGYSACHWCHVMAHESFEDPDVASRMNEHFVNIKVDREERPDVDHIYQAVHALMTRQSGGWPLTVFMTPQGDPFYAGTYFPKDARHGLPGFRDLLPHIARVYREKGASIAAQGEEVRRALESLEPKPDATAVASEGVRARALDALRAMFDAVHGGFGAAPKFPHVPELELALGAHLQDPSSGMLPIVALSALRMAEGGIHDQLGGGFCRYSVDRAWEIPHFEKMLYDNGPLLGLYAELARITHDEAFERSAEGIVAWLIREMRAPDGAFYSSLDADSEGEEGRFYVWDRDEVRALLSPQTFDVAAPYFGLDDAPNFENRAWNLRVAKPLARIASDAAITLEQAQALLRSAKATLFAARERRRRPGRDDKILTSWNALAIAGLARASRALDRPAWADLAFDALDVLKRTAWRDGRLLATRKGTHGHLNAYLDDHAFVLAALDELMQTRFRSGDYAWAREIADLLLAQFEDRENGGFFFTSHDHERLIHRGKPGHDGATPSGNGVAACALVALGHFAGESRYVDAAERSVRLFAPAFSTSPRGYSTLIAALGALLAPVPMVFIGGDPAIAAKWHAALCKSAGGSARIYAVAGQELPPELRRGTPPTDGSALAWVCRGTTCLPPLTSLADVERALVGGAD